MIEKIECRHIEEGRPEWIRGRGHFTQIIVSLNDVVVAHFFGPKAIINARKFIRHELELEKI